AGHRNGNDEVIEGELLERARADIGQRNGGAGSGERGHLVLALTPAHDFGNDLEAGIGGFPFGDVFGVAGSQLIAAVDEGDFLHVLGEGRGTRRDQGQQRYREKSGSSFHFVVSLVERPEGRLPSTRIS